LWGEGTGKNPTDRSQLGWKWSILIDKNGIPVGWNLDGANRNDSVLLAPTLDDAAARDWLREIETIWLDRGYDSDATREFLAARDLDDAVVAKRRKRGSEGLKRPSRWGFLGR
jgi:transposase